MTKQSKDTVVIVQEPNVVPSKKPARVKITFQGTIDTELDTRYNAAFVLNELKGTTLEQALTILTYYSEVRSEDDYQTFKSDITITVKDVK